MTIAPNPMYPQQGRPSYGRSYAPSIPGQRGSLRFQEGTGTDTDVPRDFGRGAFDDPSFDYSTGRINYNNPNAQYKHADETMQERAHVGSAAWVEAPALLSDFVSGAGAGQLPPEYELVRNPEFRQARYAPTVITD